MCNLPNDPVDVADPEIFPPVVSIVPSNVVFPVVWFITITLFQLPPPYVASAKVPPSAACRYHLSWLSSPASDVQYIVACPAAAACKCNNPLGLAVPMPILSAAWTIPNDPVDDAEAEMFPETVKLCNGLVIL